MKLSANQIRVFREAAEEGAVSRTLHYLLAYHSMTRVRLPQVWLSEMGACPNDMAIIDMPEDMLRRMIDAAIGRAQKYGVTTEANMLAFIVIMFVAAPNFDSHPIVREVLMRKEKTQSDRINNVWECTTDDDWVAIVRGYDAHAWTCSD